MDFLNWEKTCDALREIYTDALSEEDAEKYSDLIEDWANNKSYRFLEDMDIYVHKSDTRIVGNFCNIEYDWNHPGFIESNVTPWGDFRDVIKSIDEGKISDEKLAKFQEWAWDWFLEAFGTWGLKYNFQTYIAELEYSEEEDDAA